MSTVCFKVDSIENGAITFSVYNYPINPTLELTTTTAAGSSTSSVDMSCLADMIDEKTVPVYQGATVSAAGVTGTVPPATSAEKDMFLKGDGTWSSIPQPDLSNYATKDVATTSTNGLMSSTDKTKLDGLSQYPRITQLRRSGENTNTLANGGYNTGNTSVRYELSLSKPISFGMNRTKTIQTGISKLSGSSYDYDYYTYAVEVVAANFSGDGITVNNNIMSVPEYEGATASAAGTDGLVPAATSAEKDMFLKGDGTWGALPTNHVTTDTNQTITGVKTFGAGVYGNVVVMSAGAIDVSAGTVFTKTISANTTISFTNVPAAPATACVTLILTNGGAYTVTWPSSVKWSGGTAPDLTASGVDVLTFLTIDGGTTWYGTVNSLGAA